MLDAPQVVLTPSSSRRLAHQGENLLTSSCHRTDGHDQGVNHDVMGGNAKIGSAFDDLLGNGETHIRIFRNAGIVV